MEKQLCICGKILPANRFMTCSLRCTKRRWNSGLVPRAPKAERKHGPGAHARHTLNRIPSSTMDQ